LRHLQGQKGDIAMKCTPIIPWQLQRPEIRLIRVEKPIPGDRNSGKRPVDANFLKDKNYACNDKVIADWLQKGGNYGVLSKNGLIHIDIDARERLEELENISKLPPTFTIRTGGGGLHKYYLCPDLKKKIIFYDPQYAKLTKNDRNGKYRLAHNHLGEIQCSNVFVVGPGCLHNSGKYYEIVSDIEIAEIDIATVNNFLNGLKTEPFFRHQRVENGTNRPSTQKKRVINASKDGNLASELPIPVEDIITPDDIISNDGRVMRGSNPWHGSRSGNNFHLDLTDNVWYCHRCKSGGSWVEALAVELGVLDCSDCQSGCLRGEEFKKFLELARPIIQKMGYSLPKIGLTKTKVEIIKERQRLDRLPEKLPENSCVILSAPPRIGKSHFAAKLLAERCGVYSAGRHAILEHEAKIYAKLGGKKGVRLEGKKRICRTRSRRCSECQLFPKTPEDHFKYCDAARILLQENVEVLSASQVHDTLCPYYLLWEAVAEAKTVFCPPQFLDKVGQIREHQKQSEVLVIDEDSTLNYLFPPTVELLKTMVSKNKKSKENILDKIIERAENLKRYIESADRVQSEDRVIISCLEMLSKINEAISEFWKKEMDAIWYMDKDELIKFLNRFRDRLENMIDEKPNLKDEDVNAAIRRLDSYSILQEDGEDQQLKDYMKSILFHYSVDWQGPDNARDLLLVGDASNPRLHLEGLNGYKQVLIIGHTQAELVGKSFPDTIVLEIENFKYKDNYVVISINAKSPVEERELCIKISKELSSIHKGNRYPFMILTGSKKEQVKVLNQIGDRTHLSREGGELDQKWLFESGYANVFYSNSAISRGIDLPQYNVLVDYGCDFSIPYWTAVIHRTAEEIDQISKISGVTGDKDQQYNDELQEELDEAKAIKAAIIRDEFSNCCLRISPTPDHNEYQPKIIICKGGFLFTGIL
jgi:hypothetical protein